MRRVPIVSAAFLAACASTTPAPDDAVAAVPAALSASPDRKPASAWQYYRERYDTDGDRCIARAEYTRSDEAFTNLDANQDDVVTGLDFAKRWTGKPRRGGMEGGFFIEREPRVGDPAPDFELSATTGERYRLSEFRGKKPVVLVFGSYT